MSYKFPRWSIEADDAIEFEDLNEDFTELVDEFGGRLNEHNFAQNAFARAQQDDGIAMRLYQTKVSDDIHGAGYPTASTYLIPARQNWTAIANLTVTFQTEGGVVWVLASMQLESPLYPLNSVVIMQVAVAVNGQIVPESIVGSGEVNDSTVSGMITTVPVVVEAFVPVAPGSVTVDIVVFDLSPEVAPAGRVASRELVVVELLR